MTAPLQGGLYREVLPTGLTLLLEPDPQAQSVAAGYFVATGARDETADVMGVSHFLEHLMFKGSERLGAAALAERLDELGGQANAFTSEEVTVYHAAALPERADELLETLTELMRPALRPDDIEPERSVILEEIAMYAEQPGVRVAEALRRDYWGEHPLSFTVLGTAQTVGALRREQLQHHWARHYRAGAVTLVVTGAFDARAVRDWAAQALAAWPTGTPATPSVTPPAPVHPGTVRVMCEPSLTRTQVAFALPGLPTTHPLREAAAVLAELVGGENGALYWALLDTGLADSADLSHMDYRDVGVFEGGFSCDPQRVAEVLRRTRLVLGSADTLITGASVRRVARKAAVSILLRSESPQGRLFALGLEGLATGQTPSASELAERYLRVTPEDVRAVLRLCPLAQPTVVVLGPLATLDDSAQPGPMQDGPQVDPRPVSDL